MAAYIAIPKLGMTMQDARLAEWRAGEGDLVKKGDIVLLIETSKTPWEIDASATGYLHILVPVDEEVLVARVVGLIVETKEELEKLQMEPIQEIYTTPVDLTLEETVSSAPPIGKVETASPQLAQKDGGQKIRISPVARKMAEQHMIDITTLKGSGPEGRIVREDIEKAVAEKKMVPRAAPAGPVKVPTAASGKIVDGKLVKNVIPMKGIRRAVAENMQRSLAISAQLTYMGEIDMTEMIRLRNLYLDQEKTVGTRITYTDLLVLSLTKALKTHPFINSSIIGNEIILWEDINIGVAVALTGRIEGGVVVPVIRNTDRKTILEINAELKMAVEKTRSGRLMPDDVSGGTFTLTNLGAFEGIYAFGTPIINQPESAVLLTARTTDRAVVRDGQIVIRPIMTFSFTFDHRVIDGAPAEDFMTTLVRIIENPGLLLL